MRCFVNNVADLGLSIFQVKKDATVAQEIIPRGFFEFMKTVFGVIAEEVTLNDWSLFQEDYYCIEGLK